MKLLLLMAMSGAVAWAQENGVGEHAADAEHEALEIPWGNIFVQAFNLFLLLALLTYLLRGAMKKHFAERAQTYRELVDRAERAAHEAEQSNRLIKDRLAKLNATADEGVARAKVEAEELRGRMMQEAKSLTAKLEQEAARSAQIELEKAKGELRKELLLKALAHSAKDLQSSLGSGDQKKLQNEFVQKIELVGG